MAITVAELQATLALKSQLAAEVSKEISGAQAAFDSFAAGSKRSIGEVSADLALAKQKVSELMAELKVNADKPGSIAGIKAELDEAIPKVTQLQQELKGITAPAKDAADSGDKVGEAWKGAKEILGAFGIGLGIGELVKFGKEVLNTADVLEKMHDKTGMSIKGLQEIKIVADESGNSVEQIASSMNQFQNRMEDGSEKFVGAMKKLGLSVEEIKAMSPDEQFEAIASAISHIKDPAEQTNIAMALFGRAGADILPTLKKGFDDVKDSAVVMSDETVHKLDAIGDSMNRMKEISIAVVGTMIAGFASLPDALEHPVAAFHEFESNMSKDFGDRFDKELDKRLKDRLKQTGGANPEGGDIPLLSDKVEGAGISEKDRERLDNAYERLQEHAKADYDKFIKELQKYQSKEQLPGPTLEQVFGPTYGPSLDDAGITAEGAKVVGDENRDMDKALAHLAQLESSATTSTHAFAEAFGKVSEKADIGKDAIKDYSKMVEQVYGPTLEQARKGTVSFGDFLKGDFADSIRRAIEGGGNVLAAAGSSLGKHLFSIESGFGKSMLDGVEHLFGSGGGIMESIGTQIGKFIPFVGTLIGPEIGKLAAFIGGKMKELFGGPSQDELEGRKVAGDFESQFAGVGDMVEKITEAYTANGKSAEEAQAAIQKMWAAEKQGAEATKRALQEINEELKHHQEVMDAIHGQGFLSHDELVHAADIANQAYMEMVRSGQYTAKQIEEAYMHYQEALAAAGDDAAAAWVKAHKAMDDTTKDSDSVTGRMKDVQSELKDLLGKRDSLAKGIAAEAPEEVMGVIEAQQRGQLSAMDSEIQSKAEEYAKLARETGKEMADEIVKALKAIHIDPLHVGVVLDGAGGGQGIAVGEPAPGSKGGGGDAGGAPAGGPSYYDFLRDYWAPDRDEVLARMKPKAQSVGGDYFVDKPTLFMAGDAGPERATFTPAGKAARGAQQGMRSQPMVVNLMLPDKKIIAQATFDGIEAGGVVHSKFSRLINQMVTG